MSAAIRKEEKEEGNEREKEEESYLCKDRIINNPYQV